MENGIDIEKPAVPFFKTPHNYNTEADALSCALFCLDKSLTQQHSKEEADINVIVERFGVTGKLPQASLPPSIDEFTDAFDFQESMNLVVAARNSFMELPANIRDAFNHDPQRFVAYVDGVLTDTDKERKEGNLKTLRAMNLAVEPGPIADRTTLGDVLKAIKEQGTPQPPPTAGTLK